MGGPCFAGGGTFEEYLLEGEIINRTDRYEEPVYVNKLNSCYPYYFYSEIIGEDN